ncbi:MAG: hypothetical protein PVI86_07320 [Phycisphaerae bacterium]
MVKVNADGSFSWAYTVGGDAGKEDATGVAIAGDGTIVVAGGFQGTVDFDPTDGVDEHTCLGYDYRAFASFITRLSGDGTYLGTVIQTGSGSVGANEMTLDRDGNILLVGSFDEGIDFDPGPGVVSDTGSSDIYVTKLAPDGQHLWTNTVGGYPAFDAGEEIAVDADGNVYASGTFRGTVDFDPSDGVDRHSVVGSVDNLFVTKYYADGSYAWTRTYDTGSFGIAATPDGGVLVGGPAWLTKLNADGSTAGAYAPQSDSGGAAPNGLAVGEDGTIFVAGYYNETIDFDPGRGVDLRTSQGGDDVLVLKLHADLSYAWARTFGGPRNDACKALALGADGAIYAAGSYREYDPPDPPTDLDPGCETDNVRAHHVGRSDTFIVKLVCPELSADYDGNGVTDLRDAAELQRCFTDPGPAVCGDGCSRLDLDPDDDIDLTDYAAFCKRLRGPQGRYPSSPDAPISPQRLKP